jgi:hypothetical protein
MCAQCNNFDMFALLLPLDSQFVKSVEAVMGGCLFC